MTRTVLESKTKTVIIGFDEPFCVIGERINPTGRKKLAAELEAGNFETVIRDALEQVACGATVLDVNSGAVFTNKMAEDPRYADNNFVEPPLMRALIEIIQQTVDVPLCIDSSVPAALEAGLAACEGRPLLNSVTGEEERMELVLPLVKKYNVPVVAISNDDTGISPDPDVRFAVAKKIVERAADFGIPAHDIVVDPLVMPVGAMASAGQQVFALVRRLRDELGVNTTCGASNISFGLPHRHGINAAFLPMAIGAGMTSAIMNPVRQQEMEAIRAANDWLRQRITDLESEAEDGVAPIIVERDDLLEEVAALKAAQAAHYRRGWRDAMKQAAFNVRVEGDVQSFETAAELLFTGHDDAELSPDEAEQVDGILAKWSAEDALLIRSREADELTRALLREDAP
jgi:5-methyltetrahydrofolate--homocysteine methyltransferase